MSVTVDAGGNGLSYRFPVKDGSGTYVMPITWDGVARRIELQGSNLVITNTASSRIIAKNVILTDPQTSGGTGAYSIFAPGAGTITRSLSVMVVCKTNADYRTP